MLLGVVAGLTTGALWGLTFIAPLAVVPFSPWDLMVVRYGVFGLTSACLMVSPRFRPGPMTAAQITTGLLLGAFGYTAYVSFVFFAVAHAGVTIPPLIIATTPVVMALVSNRGHRKVPWRPLALPLGLILLGVLSVNASALGTAPSGDRREIVVGALCGFGSLVTWIAYATFNQRVMEGRDAPETLRWTGVQGVGAALGSLAVLPVTSFHGGLDHSLALLNTPEGLRFLGWCLAMGIGSSWLATLCWVVASRRLPLALTAQLIVGESVFGLLYGFAWEGRLPTPAQALGAGLQFAGLVAAIAVFHALQRVKEKDDTALLDEAAAASGSGGQ